MLLGSLLLSAALAAPAEPAVVYLSAAPSTLDPLFGVTPSDRLVHGLLHDRLFHPARTGAWSRLVDAWSVDGTEATITLVKGRSWHDGHPIDAGDVCFTLEALLQPRTPAPDGPRVRSNVSACRLAPDDPRTAVVTLWAPADEEEVAQVLAVPLAPQHAYHSSTITGDPRVQAQAIGAGPYRLQQRHADGVLELEATSGDLPFDRLVLAPGSTAYANAWSVAEHGAAATAWVPPAALSMVREAGDVGLYPFDRLVAWSVALNVHRPVLADPAARHGLDRLLDRQALRRAMSGGDDPGRDEHPWPLVSGPYGADSERLSRGIRPPTRDEQQAATWLEQAGWTQRDDGRWLSAEGEPVTLRIAVLRGHGFPPAAIGPALGWTGIEVELEVVGPQEWLASVWAGGHREHCDAVLLPRPLFPTDDPSPWFATRDERTGWGNVFDVSDPAIDDLLRRAADPTDPGSVEVARQLHGELADRRWHLFLFEERAWTAWRGPWSAWVPAPYDGWSRIDRWRR